MSKNKSPYIVDFANGAAGFTQDIVLTTTNISENEMILPLSNGIQFINKQILNKSAVLKITSAQLLALNATPVTVLLAPGAGYFIKIENWVARHGTGTAYGGIAAGEDLVLKYTNGSGAIAAAAIETIGFLDQATAQIRVANGFGVPASTASTVPGDFTPVENAAIVIQLLSGEITTGLFDLYLFINYSIIPIDFVV